MRREPAGAGSTKWSFALQAVLECAIFAALIGVLLVSVTRGFQEADETAAEGLQNFLPPEPPRDLDFESFARLGGNWQQWGEETAVLVSQLYLPEEPLSIAQQRDLLEQLRSRERVMERALGDNRYRSIWDDLITLHGRLERRLDLYEAMLAVLQTSPEQLQQARLQGVQQDVLAALENLRQYLQTIPNGTPWLDFVRANELAAIVSGAPRPGDLDLVRSVEDKLSRPRPQANPEQRQFMQRPPFVQLDRALERYLAVAADGPVTRDRLREVLAQLVQAVEQYELENLRGDASGVRAAYQELQRLAPAAARPITDVLTEHYFNYNVRILASEDFLGKFVSDVRLDTGPVRDFVMGANVYGQQQTQTTTSLDLRPADDRARFAIQVAGNINSNTVGVTDQAKVYTAGWHRFWASKEVFFDGEYFATQPAVVSVDVNSRTLDVDPKGENIPLLGHLIESIAEREVAKRGPQAAAITRGKIIGRVAPELNREIEQNLDQAGTDLRNDLYPRLRDVGLYPSATSVRTTEDQLRVSARVWDDAEMGGSTPSPLLTQNGGLTLHFHESFLNNAADRLNFGGRTMTDAEIERELEQFFSRIAGRPISFREQDQPRDDEAARGSFVFVEEDPIRVQIINGAVELSIRAGLRREGEEDIPPQIITIPLVFRVSQEAIHIETGSVRVAPLGRPASVAEQIARAGIMRRKIETSLPDRTRDRLFLVEPEGRPPVHIWVTRMKALNGWLTVWAQ